MEEPKRARKLERPIKRELKKKKNPERETCREKL